MNNRNKMNGEEKVIRHLEIIQGVINRLGHDSFLIKGWSTAILAAGVIFIARNEIQNEYFLLLFLFIVIGFWILDGYFLQQERLFREIYNDIRTKETTDFAMDKNKHKSEPKCKYTNVLFSGPAIMFYAIEVLFVAGVFLTMKCGG